MDSQEMSCGENEHIGIIILKTWPLISWRFMKKGKLSFCAGSFKMFFFFIALVA